MFKVKIQELSNENLEEGNWIRQTQQELLDCNINPTSEGKSSTKHLRDDSVGDVNLTTNSTTRNNSKQNKQAKFSNSDSNKVTAKSEESTGNKPSASSTQKCNVCNRSYATKDCYYTLKNPPFWWNSKSEI